MCVQDAKFVAIENCRVRHQDRTNCMEGRWGGSRTKEHRKLEISPKTTLSTLEQEGITRGLELVLATSTLSFLPNLCAAGIALQHDATFLRAVLRPGEEGRTCGVLEHLTDAFSCSSGAL